MQVRDLMTEQVVTVAPDETVAVAARLLGRHNVGVLPVCSADGMLQGVVTDRDIVLRCVAAQEEPGRMAVRNIMTSRVVTVAPGDDAGKAARLMAREQVRRLPVAEHGRVVGMVSLGDVAVRQDARMEAASCLREICGNIAHRE